MNFSPCAITNEHDIFCPSDEIEVLFCSAPLDIFGDVTLFKGKVLQQMLR
jgi:hypothetical protein